MACIVSAEQCCSLVAVYPALQAACGFTCTLTFSPLSYKMGVGRSALAVGQGSCEHRDWTEPCRICPAVIAYAEILVRYFINKVIIFTYTKLKPAL